MKILKTIKTKLNNGMASDIYFGQPSNEDEKKEMYKFRNDEYVKRGYIKKDFYKNGLDIDEYDRNNKCIYFIVKNQNKIIGTARLIKDFYLPTEKSCFRFDEPKDMQKIPRNQRVEIGRLIVVSPAKNLFFPKHLIMIGMFDDIVNYCLARNIKGGYSFIKNKLRIKLSRIRFPFYVIKDSKQIYSGKTLKNYFSEPKDRVWPIYYLTDEVSDYLGFVKKIYFSQNKENFYVVKRDIFNSNKFSLALRFLFKI